MSNKIGEIYNPAKGKIIKRIKFTSKAEVNNIVKRANKAFISWSQVNPMRRARIMFNFLNLLNKNIDTIAKIISTEHGKTFIDAQGEVQRGIEVVEFATSIPNLLKGEYSDSVGTGVDSYSLRQPLGVVAGITPFNFPAMVPMWMFPIAIACGNCFVLKPSERNPSTALMLEKLLKKAGLPDGVFTVLNGDKEAVDILLNHKDIEAISFVGSTPVAEHIYKTGTNRGKRVQALGGAKNHMVVMPDADIGQAVDGLMGAAFGSAGERCMAISVAVAVGDETADALIKKLKSSIKKLRVAPYTDKKADMGPLITKAHLNKVNDYIDSGISEGAKLVTDGRGVKVRGHASGYFMGGCLFDNVTSSMKIYKEEIFGPVLSIVRVKTYNEAVKLINNHEFGNGTAIFTNNGGVARNFARDIKVGMVGINVPIPVPVAFNSFGGWKNSLFGDYHMHGEEGVRFYTRLKTITTRWPNGASSGAEYHFKQDK